MSINSARGKKAKTFGDLFEQMFELRCQRVGVTITKLPSGCKHIGRGKIIPVKSPFDWILSYRGKAAFIDTKTTCEKRFAHSKIDRHQVEELLCHQMAGNVGGYIVWLRETDEVIYVPSSQLEKLSSTKGSIETGQEKVYYLGQMETFDPTALFNFKETYFSM